MSTDWTDEEVRREKPTETVEHGEEDDAVEYIAGCFDALRESVASTVLEDANPRGAIDACEAEILARLRRTPETGKAEEWDFGFKSGFRCGYRGGYHDGASGNPEDPEQAWDDLMEARGTSSSTALATQDPNAGGSNDG